MQASFAERTAIEMEQILDWYKKYEGNERLRKTNQQSQSMPDNAFIVDDDIDDDDGGGDENDDENNNNDVIKQQHDINDNGIGHVDQQHQDQNEDKNQHQHQQEHEKLVINDEESVLVKDYYTPTQRARNTVKLKTSTSAVAKKTARSFISSAVRSVARSIHKAEVNGNGNGNDTNTGDTPPTAIKIVIPDDEDESSVISSLTTPHFEKKTTKLHPITGSALDNYLLRGSSRTQTVDENESDAEFRDSEEEVLTMLSPDWCKCDELRVLQAPTLIETTKDDNNYRDEEKEVLAMLSASTSAGCRVSSSSRNQHDRGNSHAGTTAESPSDEGGAEALSRLIDDCTTTEQQVHTQIEATDDLIRNTQNMAEIIAKLQQSSSSSSNDFDSDDDDIDNDIVIVYDCNKNISGDNSVAASLTPSLSSGMHSLVQLEVSTSTGNASLLEDSIQTPGANTTLVLPKTDSYSTWTKQERVRPEPQATDQNDNYSAIAAADDDDDSDVDDNSIVDVLNRKFVNPLIGLQPRRYYPYVVPLSISFIGWVFSK